LFPFGHGLSYTTFRYSNLRVVASGRSATVHVRLTNTGSRSGAEVAQLYVGFPPEALEPPRQLKGFEKVMLKPGESRDLAFALDERALSAWNETDHHWELYPGTYTAYIGSSSRDLGEEHVSHRCRWWPDRAGGEAVRRQGTGMTRRGLLETAAALVSAPTPNK
jgi:beta-glucosidase